MTSPLETKARALAEGIFYALPDLMEKSPEQFKAEVASRLLAFASEVERETLEKAAQDLEAEARDDDEDSHDTAAWLRLRARRLRSLSETPKEGE